MDGVAALGHSGRVAHRGAETCSPVVLVVVDACLIFLLVRVIFPLLISFSFSSVASHGASAAGVGR